MGLINKLHLDPSAKFDAAMQDRLAVELIRERGGDQFLSGKMSAKELQQHLSKEWASLADPTTGKSAYGQRVGASSVQVAEALSQVKPGNANGMQTAAISGPPGAISTSPPLALPGRAANGLSVRRWLRIEPDFSGISRYDFGWPW